MDKALAHETAEELYENAPCGYVSAMPDGTIIRVNQTFLTWTGYTRDDLLRVRRLQDLFTIGGRVYHETHIAPLLRMQGFVNEVAVDLMAKDGRILPVLFNSVVKREEDGRPIVVRSTIFNASERRSYERELLVARRRAESAARLTAEFLSMVSHDIRSPLGAIVGVSTLLSKSDPAPHQLKYLRILQSSSETLLGLVNHILDFQKLETGRVTLEERVFDLRELVYNAALTANVRAEEKGLALSADIDPMMPRMVVGDPVKVGQILANLLGNAVKFTERGSVSLVARVRSRAEAGVTLEFEITDTGIGIPADKLSVIFEEFTQANYDVALQYGGSGLGLSITRKLLALFGSSIAVRSVEGQGSTFLFPLTLKVAPPTTDTPLLLSGAVDPNMLRGLRVLVAEDNQLDIDTVSRLLDEWGVEYHVVGNGREAVRQATAGNYDIVLMDIRMPEMDGWEAVRALRAAEATRELPVIAISPVRRLDQAEIVSSQFTDHVNKPIDPAVLFAKLAAQVTSRQ